MTNKEMAKRLEVNLEMIRMNLDNFEKLMIAKYPDEPLPSYFKHIEQVLGFIDKDIQELQGE